jgi:hypothetical protein
MEELISAIALKHHESGIDVHTPATDDDISTFERQIGFSLPADFKEFYTKCNGFSCNEDIFNVVPLSGITQYRRDYGENWFYFAEYMIYSDMWGLRLIKEGRYEIFNGSYPELTLTSSLNEFLGRFLQGNIFETGGLYDWHDKIRNR